MQLGELLPKVLLYDTFCNRLTDCNQFDQVGLSPVVLNQPSFEVGDEGSHVESEHFVRINARPEGVGLVQPGLERRPLLRQVVVEHRPA